MPLPFIVWAAGAAAVHGVAKGVKASSNNSEARDIMDRAQRIYDNAKRELESQRTITTEHLENLGEIKLKAWSGEINRFLKEYKSFQNVRFKKSYYYDELTLDFSNQDHLKNLEIAAVKAEEIMQGGVASLGAGALAGVASYGGAMMFASASTGTAISALSGVAATNATLAWFGGGSLAAGGFGIAGGTLALGGIVAGPILAVAGSIMAAKSEENLSKARSTLSEARNAAEKMGTMVDFMNNISILADNYSQFINGLLPLVRNLLDDVVAIKGNHTKSNYRFNAFSFLPVKIDFDELDYEEQEVLHLMLEMIQILYKLLSAPLLTEQGDIHPNAESRLGEVQNQINEMLLEYRG